MRKSAIINRLHYWKGAMRFLSHKKTARYLRNLKYAALPCLLLCFMYCVWGPMEVFVGNASNFRFRYNDVIWPLLTVMALLSAGLTALIALLRRRVFAFAISCVFAFALCSYIQNMFLNLNLGLLEGEAVDWLQYTAHGWKNLWLWALMFLAIVIILMRFKKHTRLIVMWCSAVLLAVQAITFGVVSVNHIRSDAHRAQEPAYVLSGEGQYDVSAQGNVVVFLLDYFSNDYIDATLKVYPDILEPLHDFTYYDNCDPCYIGTFPSVVHMLTGNAFNTAVTIDDWFNQSWTSDSARAFYSALAQNGYQFHFYDSSSTYFGLKYAQPYVKNLKLVPNETYTVTKNALVRRMLRLSMYRYLPHMFKKDFYQPTNVFNEMVNLYSEEIPMSYNSAAFYNVLSTNGLRRVENDGKYLIVEFLRGTHPPYEINENIEWDETATLEQCAAGYLKIVAAYLDQLKAQGVYDNTTVIITSDHGDKEDSMQVMYFIKEAGVHRDKMAVSSAPISHQEMLGTLAHNIGFAYTHGKSIYDFSDHEKRERTVMRNYIDPNYPAVPKYQSTATGTHTVMYAYTYTGSRKDLRKQFHRGPSQILPLTESFN